MRLTKLLFWSVTLGTMLTACDDHKDPGESIKGENEQSKPAVITGAIMGETVTRAYDSRWESGDAIGISCISGATEYSNIAYTTAAGDGYFTQMNDNEQICFQTSEPVTLKAYYPWSNELNEGCIHATTADQTDQKKFDFLYATGSGAYNAPYVTFLFNHCMSKVKITLKCGLGVDFTELMTATFAVSGFRENGYFDTTKGEAGANAAEEISSVSINSKNIRTLNYDNSTIDYPLIFFPQMLSPNLSIAVASRANVYKATINIPAAIATASNNQLVAGYEYDVNVVLNKTGITVDGCTINDWSKKDVGDVDAN